MRRALRVLALAAPLACLMAAAGCSTPPEEDAPTFAFPQALLRPPAQQPDAGAAAQGAGQRPEQAPWQPPMPSADDRSDWIQLKSGEWLRGELTVMRRDQLEFDSDELDELEFDWEDVRELRSPRLNALALDNRQQLTGTVWVRGEDIAVRTAEGESRLSRADVLSIVPLAKGLDAYWRGDLTLGVTSQTGNTEQVTANSQLSVVRRTAFSRAGLDYAGNFGKADGVENANNHRASLRGDVFLSRRLFLIPLSVDFYRDPFQNIKRRITPGVGAGYFVIDRPKMEWSVSLAGGVRFDRYESVPAGEPGSDETPTLLVKSFFDWDLTKSVDLSVSYTSEASPDAGVNHHALTKLSVDLLDNLDLDVSVQWDRIGDPRADADGNVPERDDLRTTVGLGWDF